MLSIDGNQLESYGLPSSIRNANEICSVITNQREINYNHEEESENANANILKLSKEQRLIFDEFTEIVNKYEAGQINNEDVIFLDAP